MRLALVDNAIKMSLLPSAPGVAVHIGMTDIFEQLAGPSMKQLTRMLTHSDYISATEALAYIAQTQDDFTVRIIFLYRVEQTSSANMYSISIGSSSSS